MDPITIGTTIGTLVVAQLTKKLMEKAAEPESVAKGVNWVFAAVDNFLKIRRGEKSKDSPISAPPAATPPASPPAQVDDLAAEDKAQAVKELSQSLPQQSQTPVTEGVRLANMDDFALEQLAKQVESDLSLLEIYLNNLRFEEEKAALHGGVAFAPVVVKNTIRLQQEEIAKSVRRMNKAMEQAYGVSAPDLDVLVRVTKG